AEMVPAEETAPEVTDPTQDPVLKAMDLKLEPERDMMIHTVTTLTQMGIQNMRIVMEQILKQRVK
ncbi:hypothetical protein, partial [Natribacillus halophilus]|uniref:hypothetical protein n=1 Tax=Natribacillus halophilus TaxID=549003 RepID=UPI0015A0AB80